MFLDRKPFVFIWRPLHKLFIVHMLWPFLVRVKSFFFHETDASLGAVHAKLDAALTQLNRSREEISVQIQTSRSEQHAQIQSAVHRILTELDATRSQQLSTLSQVAVELDNLRRRAEAMAQQSGLDAAAGEIRAGFTHVQARLDALRDHSAGAAEWQSIERLLLCSLQEPARPHVPAYPDQLPPATRRAIERGTPE